MSVPDDLAATRAEPLPEERASERGDEDREAAAAEILRDSEERVAEAAAGDRPADAATEHRSSPDTT
jgi:hypothetical protein